MSTYDYYYASDVEYFSFFRLPKKLVRDHQFKHLSSDSKILYGLLLDRLTLSSKNGWYDENGRVYIVFTINDIADDLYCSKRKSIQLLNELSDSGLIERKRQGLGKPNLIYVKNFNRIDNGVSACSLEVQECAPQEVQECALQEVQECAPQEVQECALQEVQERAPQEVQERAPQEVQKCAPHNKDTDMNKTKYIYNNLSIYLSDLEYDGWMDRQTVKKMFMFKVGYDCIIHDDPQSEEVVENLLNLIVDSCCQNGDVLVNGTAVPVSEFRSRMLELDMGHIRYILGCLKKNSYKIKNIRGYILTCLYNAPVTIGVYYQMEVDNYLQNNT